MTQRVVPERETPPRVLVTGSHGFTGRYVAASLRRAGYRVLGTASRAVTSDHPDIAAEDTYALDLRDAEQVRGVIGEARPDAVVHLAALAFVGHGNADDFYGINVLGTRHLLEALAEQPVVPRKVVLASSANVYGNARGGRLDEETPFNPANDYAVSKVAMEYLARLWMDRLPLLIARPFNYTGVGQEERYLVPKIVEHFRRRADRIELGNLDVARDFSDVRAIAEAYRGLLECPAVGQAVNLCSGATLSLRDLIDMCAAHTGHALSVDVNPRFVRASDVRTLCGDNSRLQHLLPDWSPMPFADTLSWMLAAN
ncbi:GDP-mannose 4,6-dehydratase [Modicisalibacter tunisiensis]|uniref:GDP-mannose 4,6-dehydratase n=1 Tax=Modicisalibacter tunisiensis TaxID=390637 RepID=A0ABS7WU48_9GAMM|nr:GDP-mannose 4,6-dehydratase [Modicisalibacter tunisiensis]MBZ9566128.1 GDP-mannose 4,6-dehydratase [Modicisalibacter tunisiensis]